MASENWFITGSSRGFGREWAIAAQERGDAVAATARDTSTLDDLVARFGDNVLAGLPAGASRPLPARQC
jgi:short-subunit dehydrogenase